MTWDHQTVNVNLTTQTKVDFDFFDKNNYCYCCYLLFAVKQATLLGDGDGGEMNALMEIRGDIEIIEISNYIQSKHLVL